MNQVSLWACIKPCFSHRSQVIASRNMLPECTTSADRSIYIALILLYETNQQSSLFQQEAGPTASSRAVAEYRLGSVLVSSRVHPSALQPDTPEYHLSSGVVYPVLLLYTSHTKPLWKG
jgi:hypothetical protein